jgi:hypothetical protein
MKPLPRKVLMVHQEPPRTGWIVMLEVNDRTRSMQLSEEHGVALMTQLQDTIIQVAMNLGLVPVYATPETPHERRRKNQRG